MMMLRTSLSSSSSTLPSPSRPLRRRRKSKSRGVHVNSSASRENRYETSFSSSSASGARGVAANSFPRDDDVEEVVHTVAPGDSLYGVAIAYDVDPRDLIVSNRSSSFCSRSRSSSKRKSCISFVFEFLIQKYATSSIEKNKM